MDTQKLNINEIFDIRSPNEWMRESRSIPVPKKLFGDLWQEGEIAIMFADTGKGKSVLSVQIAESIARGGPIYPFEMTAKPQRVLYLDFELTGKQFEMRYTQDHDERQTHLKKPHRFSERFKRVELKPEILDKRDGRPIEEALRDLIEPLIEQTGVRVLIIDNITYLKRTAESTREAVPLMKELHRLKRRHGLSILVVAHTPKRDVRRPLVVNDLQGSKVIANYADNIFSIGHSRQESGERYIKHIKPRSSEINYDATHIPVFKLRKIGGNFLGFEFAGFSNEAEMLREPSGTEDHSKIKRVKEMHDAGIPIRKIAEELGFSRSATHRYLQRWRPGMSDKGGDRAATAGGVVLAKGRHDDFPGIEEYDAADNDPRLDVRYSRDDVEARFFGRERYLIQLARADARTAYRNTGTTPRLDEHVKYRAFKEAVRVYNETGVVQDAVAFMFQQEVATENTENSEETEKAEINESAIRTPQPAIAGGSLIRSLDSYGREIHIEEFTSNGKPHIWYRIDEKGIKRRCERKGFAVMTDVVDEIALGP